MKKNFGNKINKKNNFNPNKNDKFKSITIRYILLLILIQIFLSSYFYDNLSKILTIISHQFLNIFSQAQLIGKAIVLENGDVFLIVKECVAISAYILISLIFLTLPINLKKTYKVILKSYIIFTIFNLLRIFILMLIHIYLGKEVFDKVHIIFYEFVSGIIVAFIVIYYIKKLKINNKNQMKKINQKEKIFPVYTDLKFLLSEIKLK